MKRMSVLSIAVLALFFYLTPQLTATPPDSSFLHIPETISDEAARILKKKKDPALKSPWPAPDDVSTWMAFQKKVEKNNIAKSQPVLDLLQPEIKEMTLGDIKVLEFIPRGWKNPGKLLIYTHGGAYTFQSARSTAACAALVADATGLRVISVDYTLAPHARWNAITDQVLSVFESLLKQGFTMKDLAIFGDSAGGGLAAGSVLKMRDKGMGMPAAVVLLSPWSDITNTGDTYETLKGAEPFYLYEKHLKNSADAYATPEDQKHPYVSPVYGDYTKGFPPTLIQGGTKEIFMSNFIRHYQAIDMAGQYVKLDLYEGMIHDFQIYLYTAPESAIALGKVAQFLDRFLEDE